MKPQQKLNIEWRHLDKNGATCSRCAETGRGLRRAVRELRRQLKPKGVGITFTEKKLTGRQIRDSNLILFNGRPIEALLPATEASTNHCSSCSRLVKRRVSCRTVKHGGKSMCAIPARLIRKAALASLHQVRQLQGACCD